MRKATDIAERRSRLSPDKLSLLEKRLEGDFKESLKSSAIEKRPDQTTFPLSFAQERFWFLDQLEPGNPVYNRPMGLRLKGALDVSALERAMNAILGRHDVLRANFSAIKGRPIQSIAPTMSLSLDVVDLSAMDAADRENEFLRLSVEEALRPFELAKDPLLRAMLFRIAMEDYILLVVMHHIVCDGWSAKVFTKELSVLYEAFSTGPTSPLPELPIQYADYAYWQHQRLKGEFFDQQVSYWRERLADGPPLLDLPINRPRQSFHTYCGANQTMLIPSSLLKLLNALSRKEDVTLFMILLAAFKVLLYRYTGQMDIVVGSPTAGRSHVETEDLIGFFVNTLVLRTDLSSNPSFRQLLQRIREVTLGAYEHGDLPLGKLVEVVKPERELSRNPFFQVLFNFENVPEENISVPKLSVSEFEVDIGMAAFDLSVEILEKNKGLYCLVNYNTDLFESATIRRMIGHFQILLEGVVANPEQRLSDVRMLTDPERRQMLVDWNDTSSRYPDDRCVHHLFEQQVEHSPDAVAVVYGDEQFTYRQLNTRANQLACYLNKLGVGPDVLVGICVKRSLEMVVGVLGILKAGGAYVPFDPAYPAERLAFMLSDTQTPVLLTQQKLLSGLPETEAHVVCLDTHWEAIGKESHENSISDAVSENLAYVIYTSGSTGTPKGVMISHDSLVNYIDGACAQFELKPDDRILQFASISFDAAAEEIYPCLIRGAALHLHKDVMVSSVPHLLEVCSRLDITVFDFPTAFWHQIVFDLADLNLHLPESVRLVIIGGERVLPERVADWQVRIGQKIRLINTYGPTEATIVATSFDVTNTVIEDVRQEVPIGRPPANVCTYVLDKTLQPIPIGVAGELHIGGAGVARGYLNRPELTAEKFIPDPFSNYKAARLYKTGDLVRYLSDGNLEFLGRIDHQVKIRGFRIELGEVESVLGRHPAAVEAVVIAREDMPGDKRLVAYVVTSNTPPPTFSELRSFLKEKLPDYMIPTAFVFLDLLPLTPNGKVDRRALPAPDVVRPDLQDAFVAPRSQSEELVAGIWSNVLGLERIGVYDSFFELGGHSLLAVQIISRIRELFEVELPLRALFEAPTVAGFTERIEAARRSDEGIQPYPLQAVSRDQDLPLSFAQERLWFLYHLEPDSAAYSIPRSIRLKGVLRKGALQKTYVELARRHETLRTTFQSTDGNPVLRIAAEPNIVLDTVDLRHLPEVEREAEARRLSEEDARKPFDLARGPLFRIRLFQLEDEQHVLHFNMHHIISDFWSFGVMAREIAALYTAFTQDKPVDLPELPVQYADYAVWQRQWLQGEALEAQLNYWKDKLGGELPVLELPTDRLRPAVQTHRGAMESLALPKELTDALQAMSRREGVTLFMTLLAAFKTLLYRLTGQEDTIVGTPIAGRNRTELEGLIGFFINTIVMRTDLSGNPTFRELLGRVRETALGAYAHQDIPFEKLVEELSPERDLSRPPLFQVFFNHIVAMGDKAADLPGLETKAAGVFDRQSKFDMSLYVLEGEGGIEGGFVYNTDLFDAERIERMVGHFQTLLEGIVADPDQRISHVQILTDAERQQLLIDWNDTSSEYPRDRCVHQLFEQQVEQSPDAVAVVYEDEQLTYRELNIRANQLARYLNKLGVGPEVLAGICLERSLEMIVGVLGILKAGGAYVPLDAAYPAERLAFMLSDAQIPVLLTQKRLVDTLPVYDGDVICLDNDVSAIAQESEENPTNGATPANLVYVIYTSGSTGRPKGVLIPHRALVNHSLAIARQYGLGSKDRVLQFASISFDLAAEEIFPSLLKGATVVLQPDQLAVSFTELLQFMEREKLTVLNPPTAFWHEWVSELSRSKAQLPRSVRLVIPGGEKASKEKFATWRKLVGNHVRWINGYGPTEATITTTNYEPTSLREDQRSLSVPIGRPIANTRVYILSPDMQPVPIGVRGELYIGGAGLSRGYLNRPELTAEKFIPDPFSEDAAARLYKTGDLARYFPDGTIEYLGRIDHQVKIRGFRIELGEIESVLGRHPAVEEAVVIAREDVPGDKRLVAYVVASQEPTPTFSKLRSFLKEKLPDYMIPSALVFLELLPLTPNGKVDRRALPAPDVVRPDLQEALVAPRSQSEELVAGIWSNVLGLDRIGVYDNFFELGGHSLLAVQIVSRIREVFEVELPLRALFEAPTVAGLTERIEAARRSDEGLQTYPLQAVSRDQDLPLSFAQERLWFLHHFEPDSVAYSMPSSIRLKGVLNKNALQKTYIELACRHETLRTTFHSTDGNPMLRITAEPNVLLDTVDLRHLPEVEREAEVKRLSAEDANKPFDLTRGPLFRIRLFQLEDEEHVLHFNMHHIISDGWSFGVMAREIAALYTAFIKGTPADLPELPVQYADYAVWQRQWLQGEALEAQLTYWKDKLGGELPVLELPTDRPRPAVQTHRGAIESLALSKELTDALHVVSRREGVTLFMTLLAAFKSLLYRITGQADTIVGTPIAGRNRTEVEGLIGFFMNTIVLRTDLSGQPSFQELLGRVRETALGAYAHQDIPFAKLVEELSPERDLSRTPMFQVFFNHIVAMGNKAGELPGIETEAVGGLDRESKFDMTVTVLEGEGGLAMRFEYNTDLFDAERIERMVGHFQTLLEGIVADPGKCICDLPILDETECRQLLVAWNDTAIEYPRDKCLHQLFEAQVERTPDAMALVTETEKLTYRQLNNRANRVAQRIISLGVGPENIVGVLLDRSAEMIAAILGILKAGGAYLPLDPEYPRDRLAFMLSDSQAQVLVTQSQLESQLPEKCPEILYLDTDWKDTVPDRIENPQSIVQPNNLAYLLYTSGSTGLPKGVAIEHHSPMALICWAHTVFSEKEMGGVLLSTSICFDLSVFEIFSPLTMGGKAILANNLLELQSLRAASEVTLINTVPSAIAELLRVEGIPPSVCTVNLAGELLKSSLVQEIYNVKSIKRVYDLYGPSEDTTYSTWVLRTSGGPQTVGRPISNTQIYILDQQRRLAPVGVAGELYLGGDGLARGYLHRSDLTSEKFIPNPFSEDPAARLYMTGDLARYFPDGTIEYLGRIDHQVKIRGFRIELEEIESVLNQHPTVQETVAVVREDRPGDKRLAAYVVPNPEQTAVHSELRRYLNSKLPDYMVPSAFVELEAMPLTPNRKVDRRALPAPDNVRQESAETFVAPRDELELQLTKIWQKVLGIKNVSINDNFFDLGGYSLLVVQLFARIQKIFGRDLPLATLFQAPTIEQLAGILRQKDWSSPWSSLVPIQHGGSKPPFFSVHGCTGKVLHFYDLARLLGSEQPFFGLGALGLEKGQVSHTQFEDMAAHYIKEIRTIQFDGPYFISGSGDGCGIAMEMAHQLESQGQNIGLIVLFSPTPFKPKISSTKLYTYRRSLRRFFFLLNNLLKKRPLIPSIINAFLNRVLWHWRIFHKYLPRHIFRWRRFVAAFNRARFSYTPRAYQGRIICFLSDEFSLNHKKLIPDWYKLDAGGIDIRFVPGTINTMFFEPHVRILAEQLKACLDEAQTDGKEFTDTKNQSVNRHKSKSLKK